MNEILANKINLLIQLALIDGDLDIRERSFIYNVCLRNGVDLDTIGDMIEQSKTVADLRNLPLETRIDYITDCFLLITVDGNVLMKETSMVTGISQMLGFDAADIDNIIQSLYTNRGTDEKDLRARISEILKGPSKNRMSQA